MVRATDSWLSLGDGRGFNSIHFQSLKFDNSALKLLIIFEKSL